MMRMLMMMMMMDAFIHIWDRVGEGVGGAMMTTLLCRHLGQSPEKPFYFVFTVLS